MLGCALVAGCTALEQGESEQSPLSAEPGDSTEPSQSEGIAPTNAPLAALTPEPVGFELACDNAGTCCPPDLTPVVGTAAADTVSSATLNQCYVALGSDDNITITAATGRNAILAGPGNDTIASGYGPGLLYGGDGNDFLGGRASGDFLSGGAGTDTLRGNFGNDVLDGGAGDDTLRGENDNDILVPGQGKDTVYGGNGDDIVVIRNLCELESLEWLAGELGNDTLVIPAPLATVTGMGVTVSSFENVIEISETLDCGVNCDCGQVAAPDNVEVCDFSWMEDSADGALAESACLDVIGDLGVTFAVSLPTGMAQATLPAEFSAVFTAHPTVQEDSGKMSFIAGGEYDPVEAHGGTTGTNPAAISNSEFPCDLPQSMDVGIGQEGDEGLFGLNCSPAEQAILFQDLQLAYFWVWRARRSIREVVDHAADPVMAEALWTQGVGNLNAEWWFGEYDAGRVLAVHEALEDLWTTFNGNWKNDYRMNIQCWKPTNVWQSITLALFKPDSFIHKMVLNPCSWAWSNTGKHQDVVAHTWYTWSQTITNLSLEYSKWSLEVCPENYFAVSPFDLTGEVARQGRARTLIHEFLHHKNLSLDNMTLPMRDNHDSTDLCHDENAQDVPCYGAEFAHNLAQFAPEHAITNNDNYALYASIVGLTYTQELCDAPHNGLCFPSDCCGNTVIDALEECDTNNFGQNPTGGGGETCWTQVGVNNGSLLCTAECQIDTSRCFAECGDGTLEAGEVCDAPDFGGQTCQTFGFESGSLSCDGCIGIGTGACEGGTSNSPPASYEEDCTVTCGECPGPTCGHPELCYLESNAGLCEGGPCMRTDPTNYVAGQFDPTSDFHPKGNFRDSEGNLYRCEDIESTEATCVDEFGWGVCKKCGFGAGETMLGCSCNVDDDCGLGLDLVCWGGQFPNGGFCWPPEGPPEFQCKQGGCGQGIRNGLGGEDASYCEHYADGEASCQPERCDELQAKTCGDSLHEQVCGTTNNPTDCIDECVTNADCQLSGWPAGMTCSAGRCV